MGKLNKMPTKSKSIKNLNKSNGINDKTHLNGFNGNNDNKNRCFNKIQNNKLSYSNGTAFLDDKSNDNLWLNDDNEKQQNGNNTKHTNQVHKFSEVGKSIR